MFFDFVGSGFKMSGFSPLGSESSGNPLQVNIFLIIFAIFEKLEFARIESLGMHLKLTLWITYLKISN